MNGYFYGDQQLVNFQHAERIAEAEAYRRAREVEQYNARKQPAATAVRSFGWLRRLGLRFGSIGT